MILIVKKDKILLITLVFLLAVAVYSLNFQSNSSTLEVVNNSTVEKVVILDPGHGGEDPGAVSDYNQLAEKDVNLVVALKVKELLEQENYKVIMTREEDVLKYQEGTKGYTNKRRQDLLNRKKLMDESKGDIIVSIHLNKFPQTQYRGAQTFFPKNSSVSKKLAESIQKSLKENVDSSNEREALVKDSQIIILKDIKKPTVVVECGFLSNPEEEKLLGSEDYQGKIALGIKEGIKNYYEGKK